MLKFSGYTPLVAGTLTLLCMQTPLFAQSLQNGPDFLRGGEYLMQINKGDETYDPYELQRSFTWDYDEPKREGVIDVRIDVKADGTVDNAVLLGGFYDEEFLKDAMGGIKTSNFTPAIAAGMPIDWPALEMRIILRGDFLPALTADMKPNFDRLVALNTGKNFAEAETLANDMLAKEAHSLFDYALLQDQLATVYMNTDRVHEALIAMRNTTSSSKAVVPLAQANTRLSKNENKYIDDYLPPEIFVIALQKRMLLAMALNQTGEVLATYADLLARNKAVEPSLQAQVEQMNTKLTSEEPIGSPVKLVQGKWIFQTSTRRVFGVTGLQGQVDSIDIACDDSVKKRMVFTNDTEFGLPASWQNCKLEFHGTDGSMFNLYEYLN